MTTNIHQVLAALLALVMLTTIVGFRMLFCRVQEMRKKRIHPQAASNSVQMSAKLEDVQAADNFKNLFEVPVLFYTLGALAIAMHHTPSWLVTGLWVFVVLRVIHSAIHCSYNKVMHRLAIFLCSFGLLLGLWITFFMSLSVGGVN